MNNYSEILAMESLAYTLAATLADPDNDGMALRNAMNAVESLGLAAHLGLDRNGRGAAAWSAALLKVGGYPAVDAKRQTNGFNRAIWALAPDGVVYYRSSCHTWHDDQSITRDFPATFRCGVYNTERSCVEEFVGEARQLGWDEFATYCGFPTGGAK